MTLQESMAVVMGRPRSGRRTNRCSQPACLHRWAWLSVPQAGGQRKVRAARRKRDAEHWLQALYDIQAKCPAGSLRECSGRHRELPVGGSLCSQGSISKRTWAPRPNSQTRAAVRSRICREAGSRSANCRKIPAATGGSARIRQHRPTHAPDQEPFMRQRPNPSIEGTSTSKLRLLAAAPHVKR